MLQPKDTDWLNGYRSKTHIYNVYKKPTSELKRSKPQVRSLQTSLQTTFRLKVRGWESIFHTNGKQKKAGVAILISDKIDLKVNKITRDKEGHYIMIKGSIQEENITIVNIYGRK